MLDEPNISLRPLVMARVLLADDDPTSRLTLQTVLRAGGYEVDAAASAAEAVGLMDAQEYELVLSDLHMEAPESGLKVLAHARMMEYKPATALVSVSRHGGGTGEIGKPVLIEPEDVPGLLDKIADLISGRAMRRLQRQLRATGS